MTVEEFRKMMSETTEKKHANKFELVQRTLRRGNRHRYCYANDFRIRLPDAATLSGLNLARDWSAELKRAEAER